MGTLIIVEVALTDDPETPLPNGRPGVLILLTNDDGIYAPGLAALDWQLRSLGEVCLVAPTAEQSGVGHSITYLTPLIVKEVHHGHQPWGWAVEGSPADCVKIGVLEFCPRPPDLVVSGINSGLNAGINVLYSGTVAAAIEGAFFGITSVAVSLEYDQPARFDKAAALARSLIQQIIDNKGPQPQLYNANIPTAALAGRPEVRVVPMDVTPYGDKFERRTDPWGRDYYWATGTQPPPRAGAETDLSALKKGFVTITPLDYDMTKTAVMADMQPWKFDLPEFDAEGPASEPGEPPRPVIKGRRRIKQPASPEPGQPHGPRLGS